RATGPSGSFDEPHREEQTRSLGAEVHAHRGPGALHHAAAECEAERVSQIAEARVAPHVGVHRAPLRVKIELEPAHEREDVGDATQHQVEVAEAAGWVATQSVAAAERREIGEQHVLAIGADALVHHSQVDSNGPWVAAERGPGLGLDLPARELGAARY